MKANCRSREVLPDAGGPERRAWELGEEARGEPVAKKKRSRTAIPAIAKEDELQSPVEAGVNRVEYNVEHIVRGDTSAIL